MFADLGMQADLLKEALGKSDAASLTPRVGRELAAKAGATKGGGIALACRTFGVSETCSRYSPKHDAENEFIADLLEGLTRALRTWGFGLCILYRRNVRGHIWNHKRVRRIYCELELRITPASVPSLF